MSKNQVIFAIVSSSHVIITGAEAWINQRQLDPSVVNCQNLPIHFTKIVDCGYEFHCEEIEVRETLIRLGFKESISLKESGILNTELLF